MNGGSNLFEDDVRHKDRKQNNVLRDFFEARPGEGWESHPTKGISERETRANPKGARSESDASNPDRGGELIPRGRQCDEQKTAMRQVTPQQEQHKVVN
jgi:hypothetical protein